MGYLLAFTKFKGGRLDSVAERNKFFQSLREGDYYCKIILICGEDTLNRGSSLDTERRFIVAALYPGAGSGKKEYFISLYQVIKVIGAIFGCLAVREYNKV